MHNIRKSVAAIWVLSFIFFVAQCSHAAIDLGKVDATQLSFPSHFLFGVTANTKNKHDALSDQEELDLIKPLGVTAFNFILDWALIEPQEGQFDTEQLKRITQKCKELNKEGIKPAVYLCNSEPPAWFNAKDGFEHAKNNVCFVRYCKTVFECLHNDVHMWLTFYQPAAFALERYFRGNQFPYKKDMQLALEVLKNILDAHIQVYEAIKGVRQHNGTRINGMPDGSNAQIGISHHLYLLEPYHVINPFDQIAVSVGNGLNNKLVIEFFKTGHLKFTLPFLGKKFLWSAKIDHVNKKAMDSLDFIGLIYHSHCYIKNFKTVSNPNEVKTDLDIFTIYPQGLYDAIKFISQLKKPIHIIGNGIADAQDMHREQFIKQHLYVVNHALKKGYDVRSYFYRMLQAAADEKYSFGLYVQDDTGHQRLQKSASHFSQVIEEHKKRHNV